MDHAKTLIEQLEKVTIRVNGDTLAPLEILKQTARSGKLVRIDKHQLMLPKRSIFDHIVSLSEQAHLFYDFLNSMPTPCYSLH